MSLDIPELMAEVERLGQKSGMGNQKNNFLENFVKMPKRDGFVQVRLLPPVEVNGKKIFYQPTRIHSINGKSIHCLRQLTKMDDGSTRWMGGCPICECYSWLWKKIDAAGGKDNPDPKVQALVAKARSLKPQERFYYNVIVQKSHGVDGPIQTPNDGPKILSVGKMLHEKIIKGIFGNKATNKKPLGDVSDVKDGRDFNIARQMKSNAADAFPEYDDSAYDDETSPLAAPDKVKEILSKLHNLADLRKLLSYDECDEEVKVFLGYATANDNKQEYDPEKKWGNQSSPIVVVTPPVKELPVKDFATLDINQDGTIGGLGGEAMDMSDFEEELEAVFKGRKV